MKRKLKKLQTGLEGHSRDGLSSTTQSISRGQWERRLQTDIQMAKQALCEALSPEKPSYLTGIKPTPASTYVSSTENIAKMLKGWMRNGPKQAQTNSATTQNSFNSVTGADSMSSEEGTTNKEDKNGIELTEAFESLFGGFDSFDSSNSDFSQSMSPDCGAQVPLSLLEKWLLDEGANQGKEYLSDVTLDENNLF